MGQDTPQLADKTVDSFMALDEGSQRQALGQMSDGTKQLLLGKLKTRQDAKRQAQPGALPAPPSAAGELGGYVRDAVLGVTKGLGFPQNATPGGNTVDVGAGVDNAAGFVGNVAKGALDVAGSALTLRPEKQPTTGDKVASIVGGPLGPTAYEVGKKLVETGAAAKDALDKKDYNGFSDSFGDMIGQLGQIWLMKKGMERGGPKIKNGDAFSKASNALETTPESGVALKGAWPELVKWAKRVGIDNVDDLWSAVKSAHGQAIDEFKTGFDPIKRNMVSARPVVDEMLNDISPDKMRTPEGRALRQQTLQWAVQKGYLTKLPNGQYATNFVPLEKLDADRMEIRSSQQAQYGKSSGGRVAAEKSDAQLRMEKAGADAMENEVYKAWGRQNFPNDPPAEQLRKTQLVKLKNANLWTLQDFLDGGDPVNASRGKIGELRNKQAQFEGKGITQKYRTHSSLTSHGIIRSYISGIADVFSGGPEEAASKGIHEAFDPSLSQKAGSNLRKGVRLTAYGAKKSLPIDALVGNKTPFQTVPKADTDDDTGE